MITESQASRLAALAGRLALVSTGTAGPAAIWVFGGTRPATPDDLPGSAMIGSVPLTDPAGSVALVGGVPTMTLTPLEPGMNATTGVPTWARVVNRDGAPCFDMDAGIEGSGPGGSDPECVVSDSPLYAGGLLTILSASIGQ